MGCWKLEKKNKISQVFNNYTDIRIAIIIPTYYRKDKSSINNIRKLLDSINDQLYKYFHIFLIGDNYEHPQEIIALLENHNLKNKITFYNNPVSFRSYKFMRKQNYWAFGGSHALLYGVTRAIKEGYDYYAHIDDDDTWLPNHLSEITTYIRKFPLGDFYFTQSKYCKHHLLPGKIYPRNEINYNIFKPLPGHSCHSTHVYSLKTFGITLIEVFSSQVTFAKKIDTYVKNITNKVKTLKKSNSDEMANFNADTDFTPADYKMSLIVCDTVKYKSIYIPIVTCIKESDGNYIEL